MENNRNEIKELQEYVGVLEKIIKERDRVMDAIPECPVHGPQCVPHALEWIDERKKRLLTEEST